MGSLFTFWHFLPKKAHPCVIPHLLSHCASKSANGSSPHASHKSIVFHAFAQKPPWTDLHQILYSGSSLRPNQL